MPTKYFWCDMTDMFLDDYPDSWIDECVGVMAWTRRHTHLVLTKRAARLRDYSLGLAALTPKQRSVRMAAALGHTVSEENCGDFEWPLQNVVFLVSVENQTYADQRIPLLLQTPAAVRGVSYEPALGPVDFEPWLNWGKCGERWDCINWIICGAESGPGARPFNEDWARFTRNQCVSTDTAFFYKQNAVKGHKIPTPELDGRKWMQFPRVTP